MVPSGDPGWQDGRFSCSEFCSLTGRDAESGGIEGCRSSASRHCKNRCADPLGTRRRLVTPTCFRPAPPLLYPKTGIRRMSGFRPGGHMLSRKVAQLRGRGDQLCPGFPPVTILDTERPRRRCASRPELRGMCRMARRAASWTTGQRKGCEGSLRQVPRAETASAGHARR
jgi:hypothetical protein